MGSPLSGSLLPRPAGLVLLAGFTALYLPTYWRAANDLWRSDEQAHGAVILLVVAWLFWRRRRAIAAAPVRPAPAPAAGWAIFALGLLLYVVGRSQDVSIFEIGSQIPVLAGALLVLCGWPAVRAAGFPLFYLAFMAPLPGFLVDAVTGPLKQWVSLLAEDILYAAGYPVARSGVVLSIGQYQLLVADACSGLHSMFSLAALGVLFMYLNARPGLVHNFLMLASILPIAFAANVIRVVFLALVTYHLGDEAGQGFLHGTAGIVLIVCALLFLFLLDAALAQATRWWRDGPGALGLRGKADA